MHVPIIGWLLSLKPGIAWMVGILALVLILAGISWPVGRAWRLYRLSPAQAIAEIYKRFSSGSRPIKASRSTGETPYELSSSVAARIKELEKGRILSALFKPAVKDAEQIVHLYAIAEYSQHPLQRREKLEVINAWKRLGWRLRLAGFLGKIWRS